MDDDQLEPEILERGVIELELALEKSVGQLLLAREQPIAIVNTSRKRMLVPWCATAVQS
jgi:hypothetical protein